MKLVKRLSAACTYTNKSGEEKTNWVDMGAMWKGDNGKYRLSISAMPTMNWSGWVELTDPFDEDAKPRKAKSEPVSDDDIPF